MEPESTQSPLRIFLSYSSKDRLVVRHLYEQLARTEGIEAWFDDTILMPGEEWEQEVTQAIQTTDVVLVCLSPNIFTRSGKINSDIVFALEQATTQDESSPSSRSPSIIVVRLETCDTPETLRNFQSVNWFDKHGQQHLIEMLQEHTSTKLIVQPKVKGEKPKARPRDAQTATPTVPDTSAAYAVSHTKIQHTPPNGDGKDPNAGHHDPRVTRPMEGGTWKEKPVTPKPTQQKLPQTAATTAEQVAEEKETKAQPFLQRWWMVLVAIAFVLIAIGGWAIFGANAGEQNNANTPIVTTLPETINPSELDEDDTPDNSEEEVVIPAVVITPTAELTATNALSATDALSATAELTDTNALSATAELSATNALSATAELSATNALSATAVLSATNALSATAELSATNALSATAELSATNALSATAVLSATNALSATATLTETQKVTGLLKNMPRILLPSLDEIFAAPEAEPEPEPVIEAEPELEPEPEPPPPSEPFAYEVEEGDTLRGIAEQFGVSTQHIIDFNGLTDEEADVLKPGQVLWIKP